MKKPETILAKIPLSAYDRISAVVVHCGEDNNIYLAFKEIDRKGREDYVPYSPGAWRMTTAETAKLAIAFLQAINKQKEG